MIKMEETAKFAKLEHLSSYSAAEALGSGDLERISYYPKKGWFLTRWQAFIIAICAVLFVSVVFYLSRSTYQYNQLSNETNYMAARYPYHKNVTEAIHILPSLEGSTYYKYRSSNYEDLLTYLVEPIHYDVKIKSIPNFQSIIAKDFHFEGEVVIDLHSRENIDYLLIGASELEDVTPTVRKKSTDGPIIPSNDTLVDSVHQYAGRIRINLKEPLEPSDTYELKISYRGKIRSLPYGLFYMIDRAPETLQENFLVATNSDTPYARTIFPCFDARQQNATYEISISQNEASHFESNISANWELVTKRAGQNWKRCQVAQPMRTDNFQFTISSYHEQSVMTPDLQHFSVWTTKEQKDSVSFILDIGIKLIEDIQVYFNIPLPTSKVNIFALPQQIPYLKSKMGMIYTPESDVLFDTNSDSENHKRQVALLTAARIVEQWIESIITFADDKDEWLKESMVEYLKYKTLSFVEPQWQLEEEFYINIQQIEMQNDISHYIAQYTATSEYRMPRYSFPVGRIIDDSRIVYDQNKTDNNSQIGFYETAVAGIYNRLHRPKLSSKGACILRMLQHMVTEPIFRISLTLFLEKSKNEDVFVHDFWSIMSNEVENAHQMEYQLLPEGVSLNSVIKTWIENDGYPILKVFRDYDAGTIQFSQQNFLQRYNRADEFFHWYIPISFTTQKESYFFATAPRIWLGKLDEKTIDQPSTLKNEHWLLVNLQHTGFYRVNYDQNNWNMLSESLKNNEFPAIIRSQLFDDALYFGRKGSLDYSFALNLTLYLGDFKETDYTVWKPVLRHLHYIQNLLIHADDNSGGKYESTIYESFKTYIRWLIESAFHNIILKSGIEARKNFILRSDTFLWACAAGMNACKEKAEQDFNLWKENEHPEENNPIEPDLRYSLLCSVMRFGRKDDFDFLVDRYTNTPTVNPDKYEYLKSLFCYPGEDEINRLLQLTLRGGYSEILLEQIQQIWSAAGETFFPTEVPFQYLIKNWEELEKKYSEFHIIITAIVKNSTNNIYTILSRDTLKKFQEERGERLTYLEKVFRSATEAIDDKIKWKTFRMETLASWLKSNLPYFGFADHEHFSQLSDD